VHQVRVFPAGGRRELVGGDTTCGAWAVQTAAEPPIADWDSNIVVDTVESDGARPLSVLHNGKEAVLSSNSPMTTAFRGSTFAGEWVIQSPLASGEVCGKPATTGQSELKNPPSALMVKVKARCKP